MKKKSSEPAAVPAPRPKATKALVAEFAQAPEPDKAAAMARMALRPSVNAAAVMVTYTKPLGEQDLAALVESLADGMDDLWAGDLKRVEAMLYGQAHALQAIFMNLARRATTQEYMKQWEGYLRMALKAQNQCRMTLETLATIKNPPVLFAKQANVNNGGQQQINNGPGGVSPPARAGARAPAANRTTEQTELLEASHGQRLDAGAAGATGGTDPNLEAVGAVNRPPNR